MLVWAKEYPDDLKLSHMFHPWSWEGLGFTRIIGELWKNLRKAVDTMGCWEGMGVGGGVVGHGS